MKKMNSSYVEADNIYTDIVKLLRTKVCTVTFNKLDGTERVLVCTLKPDYLPSDYKHEESTGEIKNYVNVWDIENDDWRSFKLDRVKKFIVSDANEAQSILV